MKHSSLLLSLALIGCSTLEGAPENIKPVNAVAHNFTVQKGLTYSPAGWPQELKADIYAPRGLGPHAVVMVLYGGGWADGARGDMSDVCRYLAERGFAAVAVDYRHAPQYKFPAPLQDLQQALRWVHARAESLNLDADRIGIYGYSSGGHLAALIGTIGDSDPLDAPYGGPLTRVKAVVAGGAPTDLRKYEGGELVPQFLGGSREQIPEVFALASPITHVSPSDPPFFFYHGTLDTLVPIDHAEDMKVALDAVGVPAQLLRLTAMTHVMTYFFDSTALESATHFLDRYLRARAF
ncbi:MAG: alpha/beta hydrolase [Pseudomonadota bacterium]